jgi:ATP-binding cassette, subfamily B, bacterial
MKMQAGFQGEIAGRLQFKHVSFGYTEETAVLKDISFTIEPGQTIAITGQTGAGKSSVAKLINRTYDAHEGQVLVDGWTCATGTWQRCGGRFPSSSRIFFSSRAPSRRISPLVVRATQEMIEDAAKAAQAHEFILNFKDGYDTIVGERGVTLSGGQRQRLALARAFLTKPRILILDDSTSAMDSATEDQIQSAIVRAAQHQTTILITHRLSQIRWADVVLVMRKGGLEAVGNHESLMQSHPAYRRIFEQYGAGMMGCRGDRV